MSRTENLKSIDAVLRRGGRNDITAEEVLALFEEGYPCVLSLSRENRGPFAVPVWYAFRDGKVSLGIDRPSLKGRLITRIGQASITVQRHDEPYQYVMLEGEARFLSDAELEQRGETVATMMGHIFRRYLDTELAERYEAVIMALAPTYGMIELTPSLIMGESMRFHKDWLPTKEEIPKVLEAVKSGSGGFEAIGAVRAESG